MVYIQERPRASLGVRTGVTGTELGKEPMGDILEKGRGNPGVMGVGNESESGGMSHGKSEGYSGGPMGSVLGVSTTPVPI